MGAICAHALGLPGLPGPTAHCGSAAGLRSGAAYGGAAVGRGGHVGIACLVVLIMDDSEILRRYTLEDGKYDIFRNRHGLIVEIHRNGEPWPDCKLVFEHMKLFHAALNEIDRLQGMF